MKILTVMTSSLTFNGIGMSIMNYFRHMDSKKITMNFVVPNKVDEVIKSEIESKGGKVYELTTKNGKKLRQKNPIKYCRKLYSILKEDKYDIIHVHGSSAMMAMEMIVSKKVGCKVRIAHSRNTKSDNNILHYIFTPIFKNSYTHAFACGKEAGEWLFGKKENVTIIPNGKDVEVFKYDEEKRKEYRKKYNLEDKIVIGHVGNFFYQKNHDFLIDVFYQLTLRNDKYYLILAGYGDLQESIKKKISNLGIEDKVLFLGKTTNIQEWLQAMDIMVFPSHFEGFPNVLIEWQISGLPCVISDKITKDVKLTELVQFKSIEDKPEEWANTIGKIELNDRKNPIYIEAIKKAGYDINENAKKLEQIYLSLLGE